MHDVIVVDEEFQSHTTSFQDSAKAINQVVEKYLKTLDDLLAESGIVGATADSLRAYREYAGRMQDVLEQIADKHQEVTQSFLKDVDDTDQYLF